MEHRKLNTQSLILKSTGYNSQTEELEVELGDGTIRHYHAVPEYKYQRLLQAHSKGKYFNRCIASQFKFDV